MVFVCEQYAGGLVAADAQLSAFGAVALADGADLHAIPAFVALAAGLPVAALSAGVSVHHGADALVGVFRRLKQESVHGSTI